MFAASKTNSASTGGYQISRSLRFNRPDTAYLSRTPASATNQQTWTYSTWIKRGSLDTNQFLFQQQTSGSDTGYFGIFLTAGNVLSCQGWVSTWRITTQVFRDVSAWYHIVVAVDTTQATANNRIRIYVNGSEITSFSLTTNPTQNSNTGVNGTGPAAIGKEYNSSGYFDGYTTETYLIDGQALTPSSFGETNAQTGVWQPKAYSGSYGTNGFYLNFSDNSNTTAATLGKDYSGNGNNWTPNNFSVTAGAGNDSLVDSPTSYGTDTGVGGTVRGNYATWNALGTNKPNLTNGNLDADGSDLKVAISTMGVSTGKWYWEILIGSGTDTPNMGVTAYANDKADPGVYLGVGRSYVSSGGGGGIYKAYTATSTTANSAFSNANTAGATIGFALDCDAGTLAYYVNNVLGYTDSTIATGTLLFPMTTNFNSGTNAYRNTSVNLGQRPFAYTAPSGFKALCTQNLPVPAIGATSATLATKYFAPTLYTGNGTSQTITTGFMPNLVWIKSRSNAQSHFLHNNVDNVSLYLSSNNTSAEGYDTTSVTAISSTGFSLGTESNHNGNGNTYVAWGWNASNSSGGTTNTAGTITSTVSANTTSGFSVVTYTGTLANATVGHGLGVAPSMIIFKCRANVSNWNVYHSSIGASNNILLNTSGAMFNDTTFINNTAPTSTVFSVGNAAGTNQGTLVAYCFAPVAGYSAFGQYTGNGSSTGPFIYTGFRPAFVLVKNTTSAGPQWWILDDKRNTYNPEDLALPTSLSLAEQTIPTCLNFLSNGFQITTTNGDFNTSGSNYIYMAIAENPFKYSLAR